METKKSGESKKATREDRPKIDEQTEKLLKSFGASASLEQKVEQLAKNFVELEKENNRRATALKQNEKLLEKELREKEHLQREYNKGVLIRDKLEQVCREQQKLMKSIKSESMTKIRDEEEKRKETQAHFQKSINDIFATLGKNNDENLKIKEANLDMAKKFKHLAEQYDIREKQLEKLNEQIKLETQLNEAKLAKAQMESTIEREILLKEKQAALEDVLTAKKTLVEMEKREYLLKDQLHVYTGKYDEFQNSLQKSNDIFSTYKTELEKMAKRIKLLEKENYEWRLKYEKCNRALLDIVGDKQAQDAYVQKSARQLAQLQKLCRTLQAERASLIDALKANNIERPPMPDLPAEPKDIEPPPQPTDKLDAMSRNCRDLKATLAQLQGQMNAMTLEQSQAKASESTAVAKKTKTRKNKTKNGAKNQAPLENLEQPHAAADEENKSVRETDETSQAEQVTVNGNESKAEEQSPEINEKIDDKIVDDSVDISGSIVADPLIVSEE